MKKNWKRILSTPEGIDIINAVNDAATDWEEKLADYWSLEIDRVRESDLRKQFEEYFTDIEDPKERKRKVDAVMKSSRSNRLSRAIESSKKLLQSRFVEKILRHGKVDSLSGVRLSVKPSGTGRITLHDGTAYDCWIRGSQELIGRAVMKDGGRVAVFHRFITRPFYQHGHVAS